jgi:hypothetical protein
MLTRIKGQELQAMGETKRLKVAKYFSHVELKSNDTEEDLSINEVIDLVFDDEINLILQAIDGEGRSPESIFSEVLEDHGINVERFY